MHSLKESGQGLTSGQRHSRLRGVLVITEVALALTLLMGAGLMLQSFTRLEKASPGFNPHRLLTFRFDLPGSRYSYPQQKAFYDQPIQRLRALPGVRAAGGIAPLPLGGDYVSSDFSIAERPRPAADLPHALFHIITPGYFYLMQIPLLQGREFTENDTVSAPQVVIVNQEFARHYFPGENPLGKRITPSVSDISTVRSMRV